MQWQNNYDGVLNVECSDKQGLYRVVSQYSSPTRDRQWQWDCHEVTKTTFTECYWTDNWENVWDEPFFFQCPANYILTGVNSIHSNYYEDRRWKFRCCHAENHFTKNCFASDYINDWNQFIEYSVDQSYVFTGVYSYHVNAKE